MIQWEVREKVILPFEIDVEGVFLIIEFRGFLVGVIVKYYTLWISRGSGCKDNGPGIA